MDRFTSNPNQNYQRPILHSKHIIEYIAPAEMFLMVILSVYLLVGHIGTYLSFTQYWNVVERLGPILFYWDSKSPPIPVVLIAIILYALNIDRWRLM